MEVTYTIVTIISIAVTVASDAVYDDLEQELDKILEKHVSELYTVPDDTERVRRKVKVTVFVPKSNFSSPQVR